MTTAPLADLLASLAGIGRAMGEAFDPRRFLGEFSRAIERLIPRDRIVIDCLEEMGGRSRSSPSTAAVLAETAPAGS